jgi:hypothetical protein
VIEVNGKLAIQHVHMFGASPKWTKNLCIWGKAEVVTVKKDAKTGDKGVAMMFVGYDE